MGEGNEKFGPTNEKRSFERFSARFPIKIKESKSNFGANISLRDFSAGGLRLKSEQKLDVNDNVAIDVILPQNNNPITFNGRIVWSESTEPDIWDVGVKVEGTRLMKMHQLMDIVESQI